MAKIEYVYKSFIREHRYIIREADRICEEYAADNYNLTLRQLYYVFIAQDLFPESWIDSKYNEKNGLEPDTKNTQKNYKKLGGILNDARLAGEIDWDHIVDRTRNMQELNHWRDPAHLISEDADYFNIDLWEDQDLRMEIWVEKDALIGVVERAGRANDLPYFSCRGYTSQSEIWSAAQRIGGYIREGKRVVVLHLGDHDPSGIDMSRDIDDRLKLFIANDWANEHTIFLPDAEDVKKEYDGDLDFAYEEAWASMAEHINEAHEKRTGDTDSIVDEYPGYNGPFEVRRIALNMDQVRQYNPPPNPAKLTDARARGYVATHGPESWELDALTPRQLNAVITGHIRAERDAARWNAKVAEMNVGREQLRVISSRYSEIEEQYLSDITVEDGDEGAE
jgi:hypothetical protein